MAVMRPALLLILIACTPPARPLADDAEDSSPPQGNVSITALDPASGPVSGGTNVTIYGDGFEGTVRVSFGGTELSSSVFDSHTIIVTSPGVSTDTTVDVTVEADGGSATLPDGFTYGSGGSDSGGDTDSGGGAGVGGVVQYQLTQIACPDCFGLTSQLDVTAMAAFHAPVGGSWTSWLPPSGSCAVNPSPTSPAGATISVGSWVYLSSGSVSVGMRETSGTGGVQYTSNGLSEADYPRNASFDLSAPDQSLTAIGVLRTPQAITTLTPEALLYDSTGAFQPVVSWTGHTFTWGPSGGNDPFIILVDGYDPNSGVYLGSVLCVGADNGAMTVPGAYLQQFPSNTLLGVGMYRYAISSAVASNGNTIESVAQFGVLGTATFY